MMKYVIMLFFFFPHAYSSEPPWKEMPRTEDDFPGRPAKPEIIVSIHSAQLPVPQRVAAQPDLRKQACLKRWNDRLKNLLCCCLSVK